MKKSWIEVSKNTTSETLKFSGKALDLSANLVEDVAPIVTTAIGLEDFTQSNIIPEELKNISKIAPVVLPFAPTVSRSIGKFLKGVAEELKSDNQGCENKSFSDKNFEEPIFER